MCQSTAVGCWGPQQEPACRNCPFRCSEQQVVRINHSEVFMRLARLHDELVCMARHAVVHVEQGWHVGCMHVRRYGMWRSSCVADSAYGSLTQVGCCSRACALAMRSIPPNCHVELRQLLCVNPDIAKYSIALGERCLGGIYPDCSGYTSRAAPNSTAAEALNAAPSTAQTAGGSNATAAPANGNVTMAQAPSSPGNVSGGPVPAASITTGGTLPALQPVSAAQQPQQPAQKLHAAMRMQQGRSVLLALLGVACLLLL